MSAHNRDHELWRHETVRCVLVPHDDSIQVELRNGEDDPFLRKGADTWHAALNEAEYLRLLLRAGARRLRPGTLKPFALVIDDNPETSEAVIEVLKVSGMRAFGCRSGAEGVSAARELIPDLIVLDYRLPDPSGEIVCRALREEEATARIPIIAVTPTPQPFHVDAGLTDAVLTRPDHLETLVAAARLFVRHLSPTTDGAN